MSLPQRLESVAPTLALILEIEEEIGPLPVLARRFAHSAWSADEIVTLAQMALQSLGETRDWRELAEEVMKHGFAPCAAPIKRILDAALYGGRAAA